MRDLTSFLIEKNLSNLIGGGGGDLIVTSHFSSPYFRNIKWKKIYPPAFLLHLYFLNMNSYLTKKKSWLQKASLANNCHNLKISFFLLKFHRKLRNTFPFNLTKKMRDLTSYLTLKILRILTSKLKRKIKVRSEVRSCHHSATGEVALIAICSISKNICIYYVKSCF